MNRPRPTALKLLMGEKNKDRINLDEVKPIPVSPPLPNDLDPQAKRIWRHLGAKLERLNLLTEIDGDGFSTYCQITSRLIQVRKELKSKDQELVVDGRANPLTVLERQLADLQRRWGAEFGLTPRGRSGLAIHIDREESDFEKLLD